MNISQPELWSSSGYWSYAYLRYSSLESVPWKWYSGMLNALTMLWTEHECSWQNKMESTQWTVKSRMTWLAADQKSGGRAEGWGAVMWWPAHCHQSTLLLSINCYFLDKESPKWGPQHKYYYWLILFIIWCSTTQEKSPNPCLCIHYVDIYAMAWIDIQTLFVKGFFHAKF